MRTERVCASVGLFGVLGVLMATVGGCGSPLNRFDWVTVGEGVRVDVARGAVEFDGEIAVDVHHPDTPVVWLELMVTGPDSREHESLVVTRAKASMIHAALLGAGLEAGRPGEIGAGGDGQIERRAATGDRVRVEFVIEDERGEWAAHDPAAWVVHAQTGEVLGASEVWDGFVFAGSREIEREGRVWYDADGTGVIVGLTTFGSEVIGAVMTVSHASAVDGAVWIARPERVPERGTAVRVRVWGE